MIARLRAWLSGLFGGEASGTADADAPLVCEVCGTETEGKTCPLCGSTRLVSANDDAPEPERSAPENRREGDSTDDAAARLSELRDDE
ncbi:hypothetical protein [Halosegnis marinus]|uniref:Small CPxCG-related zinc finger protein n=1 Tax=Halosegnis marinus TaxID=3034023 RepID=A0ABD5ZPF8_9EURY|nr:hypothetical protein [Halosegnis sp. DT85]